MVRIALYSSELTERDVQILRLVAHGLTDVQIADELGYADRTISSYLTLIYRKIQVSSRTAAAMYAIRQGFIEIEKP
ncbi:MAG TPA: LuxR C-terminal-related transcriptional regulator [Ktedonobacteraceae bacterium]|nr:LuxR C-terminal-related transcriptional regulator [Ktedonobacteraceae bacterium]